LRQIFQSSSVPCYSKLHDKTDGQRSEIPNLPLHLSLDKENTPVHFANLFHPIELLCHLFYGHRDEMMSSDRIFKGERDV
jgi:hypothetical protein